MKDEWTQHRFSGGALALDLVNTLVRRSRPGRPFDRLAIAADADRFAESAAKFRADEFDCGFQFSPCPRADFVKLLELRERIYAYLARPPEHSGFKVGGAVGAFGRLGAGACELQAGFAAVPSRSFMDAAERAGKARQRSAHAQRATGCFLTGAAMAAASGVTWRYAATGTNPRLNYDKKRRRAAKREAKAA